MLRKMEWAVTLINRQKGGDHPILKKKLTQKDQEGSRAKNPATASFLPS